MEIFPFKSFAFIPADQCSKVGSGMERGGIATQGVKPRAAAFLTLASSAAREGSVIQVSFTDLKLIPDKQMSN